jgi:protoporphyrinogen oxidase
MKKKVAIVGGGPAGLTAAYQLVKKGVDVDVYEAGSSVGGMAKTFPLWGQLVDLGPHRFFSSDPRVNSLWLELADRDYSMVRRLTRIYYKKIFFDYPLKPINVLRGLGIFESFRCALSFFFSKIALSKETATFESWVISRFGKRLFGIFFKSYSEKLWGISCKELDSDFAVQRIKKLSFFEVVKAALIGNRKSKHKTLADEFAYPHHGTGLIYERMAKAIVDQGGQIRLNTLVEAVIPSYGNTPSQIHLAAKGSKVIEYDHIISTMPITLLIQQMKAPAEVISHAKALRFRNTILVYLLVEGDSSALFPDQWIYVHSEKLKTGRITNFRNWVPSINRGKIETILCLEYWCYDSDDIWKEDDKNLIALATEEIYQTTLVVKDSVKNGSVVRIPKCYPVYAYGYKQHLKPVEEFLSKQEGISVIGRYGAFKYNNQDHSILMGMLAAENFLHGTNYNLWELNTDYEYQESSKITIKGLVSNE